MNVILRRALAAAALTTVAMTGLAGCRPSRTVHDLVTDLHAPEATKREDAAKALRTDQGVPAPAVPHLLQVAETEQNKDALAAILMTLGKSGVPEAKPIIEKNLTTTDKDLRPRVGRALQWWLIANRKIEPDADLPEHWPYGQPGYPPLLPDED